MYEVEWPLLPDVAGPPYALLVRDTVSPALVTGDTDSAGPPGRSKFTAFSKSMMPGDRFRDDGSRGLGFPVALPPGSAQNPQNQPGPQQEAASAWPARRLGSAVTAVCRLWGTPSLGPCRTGLPPASPAVPGFSVETQNQAAAGLLLAPMSWEDGGLCGQVGPSSIPDLGLLVFASSYHEGKACPPKTQGTSPQPRPRV